MNCEGLGVYDRLEQGVCIAWALFGNEFSIVVEGLDIWHIGIWHCSYGKSKLWLLMCFSSHSIIHGAVFVSVLKNV